MNGIRFFREKAGMTQEELAIACGFSSQSVISNYESGYRSPGIAELIRIRDAIRKKGVRGVTLDKLTEDQAQAA